MAGIMSSGTLQAHPAHHSACSSSQNAYNPFDGVGCKKGTCAIMPPSASRSRWSTKHRQCECTDPARLAWPKKLATPPYVVDGDLAALTKATRISSLEP